MKSVMENLFYGYFVINMESCRYQKIESNRKALIMKEVVCLAEGAG